MYYIIVIIIVGMKERATIDPSVFICLGENTTSGDSHPAIRLGTTINSTPYLGWQLSAQTSAWLLQLNK